MVRRVWRAIFETDAALALANLLGGPLPRHEPADAARAGVGRVRSERTRIEQVGRVVPMQQERQLSMGGEGAAHVRVEAAGASVGVVAVAFAAQVMHAGERMGFSGAARKARLHAEQAVAAGD